MNTLQNSRTDVNYDDITNYLTDNHISPASVDNYQLDPVSHSLLDALGANHAIKGTIVSIFYKDLDRNPILEDGLAYRRIRLSESDVAAEQPKYLSPAGSSNHIYIPMLFKKVYDNSGKKTIYITEGEKKADVACASGIPCLALAGIYSWVDSESKGTNDKHIMPELLYLIKILAVDTAIVIYDSDGDIITKDELTAAERKMLKIETLSSGKYVKNTQVRKAASALATTIAKDTKVKVAYGFCKHIITEKINGNVKHLKIFVKNGLDDWLIKDRKEVISFLQFLETKAELPAIAKEHVSVPIGYEHQDTDDILLVYRRDLDSINKAKSTSLRTAQALRTLIGEDIEKYRIFSEDGAHKFDVTKAHGEIYKACMEAGHMSASKLNREGGLWRTADNSIVLNTSTSLYKLEGKDLYKIDRVIEGTKEVYPRPCDSYMDSLAELAEYPYPAKNDLGHAVTRIVDNLKAFNYQTGSDFTPYMILSWIASQVYCGLVSTRPHIYISGEMGSGKSHLLAYAAHLLKGNALYIQNTSNTTLAGLNNAQADNATTCILDEVELTESDRNRGVESKVSNFVELIKAAYSLNGLGFNALKGTQDGGYRDTGARAGFMFASLVKGKIDRAAESRIITVPVDNRPADAKDVALEPGLEDGKIIRRFMLSESVYEEFMAAQKDIYKGIKECRTTITERDATTLSYISAATVPLLNVFATSTNMSKTDLIKGAVANMLIIFDAASQHTDMRHEGHKSLDILRTLNITVQRRAEYSTVKVEETLIEVVRSAITNDVEAIDALALHSMYIHKDSEGTYSLCLTNAANTNILKKSHIDIEQIKLIKEVRGNYQNNGTIWYKKSRLRVQCFIPMSLLENED
ncbi:DUF3854 domain-containing protein [Acidithiobacillus ferrivorans]|nr:DUF3854 domain-containing protein [Acidithiobacillus ferrivorans]